MSIATLSPSDAFTRAAFVFALCLSSVAVAFGQNQATTSGTFTDDSIWNQGTAPAIGDAFGGNNQTIIQSSTTVTLSGGTAGVDGTLDVGRNGANGTTGTFTITGGTFIAAGNVASGTTEFGVGGTRTGIFNLQGGVASFNARNVFFGLNNPNTGIFLQSGGTFSMTNQLRFGNNGTGLGTFTGGFTQVRDDTPGDNADSIVIAQGNNTNAATGIVTITGTSTFDVGNDIIINGRADSLGSLTVAGTAAISADQAIVGSGSGLNNADDSGKTGRGIGVMTVSGGSTQLRNGGASIVIGNQDDSSGTLNVDGGHLVTNGDILMGNIGVIDFHINVNNANQTRFATTFGAAQGFFNQSGGTVDIGFGDGNLNDADDLIVGQRGRGEVNLTGGVLNIDNNLVLGNLADTVGTDAGGAGNGTGIVNVGGSAIVNVGQDVLVGINGGGAGPTVGTLNVTGSASPTMTVERDFKIGAFPGSRGRVNVSGGTLHVKTNLEIGSVTSADGVLTQTGGVLIVDGQFVTRFIETGGTSAAYLFSGGTLTSRAADLKLKISGDLVLTDMATIGITGGDFNTGDDGVDPFSGFPGGPSIDGITLDISEGFRSVDADGTPGNFQGGGVIDFNNISIIPALNETSTQVGIFWFANITGADGMDGGDDITSPSSTLLDDIDLINLLNVDGSFTRLTESEFEEDPNSRFTANERQNSYYALINGDGVFGGRSGENLGIAWFVRIPEPGTALLVLLSGALLSLRRRRR